MSAKCRAPLALPLVITGGLTDPTPCSSISLYFVFIFFLSLGGGTPFVRIYRAFLILYVGIPCPRSNDVFTSRHFGVVQWRRNVFWTGEEVTKNVQAGGYGGSRSYFFAFPIICIHCNSISMPRCQGLPLSGFQDKCLFHETCFVSLCFESLI